jgi:hypothetical protein
MIQIKKYTSMTYAGHNRADELMKMKFQASTVSTIYSMAVLLHCWDKKINCHRWNTTTYGYASAKVTECHGCEQKHNVSVHITNKLDSLSAQQPSISFAKSNFHQKEDQT